MEERNELSDIVLEKDEGSKNMKLKRVLVIAAVLVLLFLAVLIIMRALNKPDQTQEARLVLPPEPQSAPAPQANEERLFQQVPISAVLTNKQMWTKRLHQSHLKRQK